MPNVVELAENRFGSASKKSRLDLLSEFVVGSRTLVDEGAHKPFIRKMMRVVIAYQ